MSQIKLVVFDMDCTIIEPRSSWAMIHEHFGTDNTEMLQLYIDHKRDDLVKRIALRTSEMIKEGALKEVKMFLKLKIKKEKSINNVIGLDELTQYLKNQIDLDKAEELIAIKTRQYAKRQATWARSKMDSWNKIAPDEISKWIKKINKSSLKLDQLI